MPGPVAYPSDSQTPATRIPKLKIRSPDLTNDISPVAPSQSLPERRPKPSPIANIDADQPSAIPQQSKDVPSFTAPITLKAKPRSGVFGLLALKEPSQSAWQDFVKEQKKQAMQKGNASPAPHGVSKRKLPPNVPKVNSKWNGMPDIANQKSRDVSAKQSMDSETSGAPIQKKRSNSSGRRSGTPKKSSSSIPRVSQAAANRSRSQSSADPVSTSGTALSTVPSTPRRSRATSLTKSTAQSTPPSLLTSVPHTPPLTPPGPESYQSDKAPESLLESDARSIPETSLFFPPDNRDHAPKVDRSAPGPVDVPKLPDLPGIFKRQVPHNSTEQSRGALHTPTSSSEDVIKSQPRPEHSRSRSNSWGRDFGRVEDVPQWPLATKPEEVVILKPEGPKLLQALSLSKKTSSAPDGGRPPAKSSVDGQVDPLDQPVSARPSPVPRPLRPARAPLPISLRGRGPVYANPKNLPPPRPQNVPPLRNAPLCAPAHMPGRVVVKDSDLETIPESETASILFRSPSPTGVKAMDSNVWMDDTDDEVSDVEDDDDDDEIPPVVFPLERNSSDNISYFSRISGDSLPLHQDPRERLGLGKSITFTNTPPWGVSPLASEPGSPGGSASPPTSPLRDNKTVKKQVFSLFPKVKSPVNLPKLGREISE